MIESGFTRLRCQYIKLDFEYPKKRFTFCDAFAYGNRTWRSGAEIGYE
ncbi:MAG: hypothetical protein PCFJNLEI_03311 [Verrucomicrobiae bacterium]|nr:hypothetical protein [Verrucomicrobiae bacterium]